jgi:alkyldihydroxyacetonephosphate synthase
LTRDSRTGARVLDWPGEPTRDALPLRLMGGLNALVLADRDDDLPIQQWLTAKRAATDALLAAGGTLTHHSAVGVAHRPWLAREVGELGVDVLRAVKQQLDPRSICNPGVLLPD